MTAKPKRPAPKRDNRERKGKTPLDPSRPIGKGNPPIETQIKAGQVLNPHGRPRKMADLQELIRDTLAEEMSATDPATGRAIKMTRAQAMIRTMLIKSPTDRIALLEYAFGKVPDKHEIIDRRALADRLGLSPEALSEAVKQFRDILGSRQQERTEAIKQLPAPEADDE